MRAVSRLDLQADRIAFAEILDAGIDDSNPGVDCPVEYRAITVRSITDGDGNRVRPIGSGARCDCAPDGADAWIGNLEAGRVSRWRSILACRRCRWR